MKDAHVAEIEVLREGRQPVIRVTVPKGTKLAQAVKLQPTLSDIIGKLTGCLPCTSGVPLWFHEEEVEQVVRVNLENLKRVE